MSLSPSYAPAHDHAGHGGTGRAGDQDRHQDRHQNRHQNRHQDGPPDGQRDGHVFVDSTGRRARLLRRAALVVGAAFVAYAVMLGVAFMGGTALAPADPGPAADRGSTVPAPAGSPAGADVRPGGGTPAWWRAARLCRRQCRNCAKQQVKQCVRELSGNAPSTPEASGPPKPSTRAKSTRSAAPSGEGSRSR